MEEVKLGKFVKIKTGKLNANKKDENGEYPFFTCAREISRINTYAYDCECVLVAGNGELNVKYYNGKFNAYQRVYIIQVLDEEVISTKFLFYFLDKYISRLRDGSIGGVIKYIKLNHLTDISFPLFDIQTQNEIVNLVDRVNSLIEKRNETIILLDDLLNAQFMKMFGDPITNQKKWPTKKLNELSLLERGKFSPRPRNDPSYFNGEYPFIQTGDISQASYRLNSYSQTLNEKGIKVSKEFKIGTIVIAIVGATIGKTAILEIDTYATDSVIGIKVNETKSNKVFIERVLRFYRKVLIDKAPEADRANINLKILNKLDIITPPIQSLKVFATISETFENKKKVLESSKKELENLFSSLIQRAFGGQLNVAEEVAIESLINDIDLDKDKNDVRDIATAYLRELVEKINNRDFEDLTQYRKAKKVAFQLLESENLTQRYNKKDKSVELIINQ